jgi:hypothetical protein
VFEKQREAVTDGVSMRMIALMRLILAVSALLIIYIDPAEPDRYVMITYLALTLYSLYSAAIYGIILAEWRIAQFFQFWTHWADILWYLLLIALSSGTNSIFFMCFFFSILVASFRFGSKLGFWSAIASSILFTVVGYATVPPEPAFELNRFLLRPIYLLVLGYMIAYWGGAGAFSPEPSLTAQGHQHTIESPVWSRSHDRREYGTAARILRCRLVPENFQRRSQRRSAIAPGRTRQSGSLMPA